MKKPRLRSTPSRCVRSSDLARLCTGLLMKADQALPALEWLRGYNRDMLINDGLAAVIVTIMLIPSRWPMRCLRGCLPKWVVCVDPALIVYALFGSSRTSRSAQSPLHR